MTKKLNLSEAAADILGGNISAKKGGQDSFGLGKSLNPAGVAQGQVDVGHTPTKSTDENPDYTKGVPTATAPGKTGLGKQTDGVGATKPAEDNKGRSDLTSVEGDEDSYETIRDRGEGKKPTQMMAKNPGATFQQYEEIEYDLSDDVDALLAGENLSEEFKTKATTIFEAAVTARVNALAEQIEEKLNEQFEESVEQVKEELAQKLDDYLNYMVQEWVEENQIAIERGLRAEIVENFIDGLKDLFTEHYIDIPEEKVDIVEELSDMVTELEEELNETLVSNIELNKQLNEHRKSEAIYAVCEGLTQTQVEKLVSLAEGVEFTTEEEFADKLEMIKESYFPTSIKVADKQEFLDESVHMEDEQPEQQKFADPEMEIYARTISKSVKK
jgi:AcrR family transcriptional regulator